jgi:hypothetical protein
LTKAQEQCQSIFSFALSECKMAVENCDQPVKIHKIGKFRKLVKKTPSNFEMPVAARQQIR